MAKAQSTLAKDKRKLSKNEDLKKEFKLSEPQRNEFDLGK